MTPQKDIDLCGRASFLRSRSEVELNIAIRSVGSLLSLVPNQGHGFQFLRVGPSL